MTGCAGLTPICSDLYRRGRPDSSKCNGPIDACGGQVGKSSSVTVTSGDIPGPRQASRAGSTVSYDHTNGENAHLQ